MLLLCGALSSKGGSAGYTLSGALQPPYFMIRNVHKQTLLDKMDSSNNIPR